MLNWQNAKALERLSLTCHFSGLLSVLLGFVVIFIDLTNNDFRHLAIGLYVLSIGYSFVKIGAKLSNILMVENHS